MNNLSSRAARLIQILSQEEAKKSGNSEVLPEHVMLALLKSEDGTAWEVLNQLPVNIMTFRLNIEQSIIPNNSHETLEVIPSSRRLGRILDLANIEAQALSSEYVGTEHILLACFREPDSPTSRFFINNDVTIADVRNAVRKVTSKNREITQDQKVETLSDFLFRDIFGSKNSAQASAVAQNESDVIRNQKKNGKSSSQEEKSSILFEFTRDLTKISKEGFADPVVGRGKEIESVIQILSRRSKNNPVLIGEPGVGKTAIVEGLAEAIAHGKVPHDLAKKRILSLDITAVVAGTKFRGDFEERMKKIMHEIKESKDVILFIDELHTIIGAGGPEGQMDASNMLKPALSRGEIQIIGATTTKEYTKYIEKDSALERRFQMVKVEEPSDDEAILILEGIKKQYENFHHVLYEPDVIPSIVKLSKRYIPEKFLPDKAIDLLDEAGAVRKIQEESRPVELEQLENEINNLDEEKKNLVKNQKYESAAIVRDKVLELKHKLEIYTNFWNENSTVSRPHVTVHDICNIIHKNTGIPVDQLDSSETEKLINMEKELSLSVIGQEEAISSISSSVRRSRAGISSPNRPIGSFIFLGPTGVGKTKLAKTLAKFLFGSEDLLVRIDMSDYMEKHNSSRLVGAPPGYIGFENGGILTEQIRRKPYSVVLLDEIEKAHPDVFNLLLQLLEEGQLSDNHGHTVNFRNTVIIMTSNAGARQITNEGRVGFGTGSDDVLSKEEIYSSATKELKKLLSPELINRIDDILVFNPLSRSEISKIVEIQLEELQERLSEKNITIKVSDSAKEFLSENGYEPSMGARPLRRLIQKEIEDKLATLLLMPSENKSNKITVDCSDNKISVNFSESVNKITVSENEEQSQETAAGKTDFNSNKFSY